MIIGKHIMCTWVNRYVRFMIILYCNWIKMIVLTNGPSSGSGESGDARKNSVDLVYMASFSALMVLVTC